MERYEQCRQTVEEGLRQKIDLSREVSDEEVREMIDEMVIHCSRQYALSLKDRQQLGREIFDAIRRMDILQELVEEEEVTEIMINGTQGIFIERKGRLFQWDKNFASKEKLEDVIQQIVAKCNRAVNEASPIVDARLENGARVNIVLAPVALNGPIVTIRRFPSHPIGMTDLLAYGSLTNEVALNLEKWVKAGYNIIISGGTGSGKTTFLNALSQYIPSTDRVITIEDSAELQIKNAANLVRLEARNANVEGKNEVTIRDLLKASLRMRPDRIIVGEIRGAEAIDMLQAMNTGHDGSLSTGHSNSAKDMISRLETMVLMGMDMPSAAVKQQIASAIDLIVHLGRMRDKSRKVLQIAEVLNLQNGEIPLRTIYEFEEQGKGEDGKVEGKLVRRAETLENNAKMAAAGITGY